MLFLTLAFYAQTHSVVASKEIGLSIIFCFTLIKRKVDHYWFEPSTNIFVEVYDPKS